MKTRSIAVIGSGIVGAATAARLAEGNERNRVTVYEKERRPAMHQTGHNSGVVHAGLYYQPGGLKARMTRRGVELIRDYCERRGVRYDECGKLVVAHSAKQVELLDDIADKARANGVPGIRIVDQEGIREVEPHTSGIAALHSPTTAIIDYPGVAEALVEDTRRAGGEIRFDQEVRRIFERGGRQVIETPLGEDEYDYVIVCAGLQSDRLAARSGAGSYPRIVPFYGDYFELTPAKADLVRGLLYPVPDPNYPFLGVHLTRTIDGTVTVGPNAFLSFAREKYGKRSISIPDSLAIAGSPAFWRFAATNMSAAVGQLKTASKKAFVEGAQEFIPSITSSDLTPGTRGIRAQAMNRDGSLLDDFAIQRKGNTVFIRNAPSPAATSSMAIAEHIVTELLKDDELV